MQFHITDPHTYHSILQHTQLPNLTHPSHSNSTLLNPHQTHHHPPPPNLRIDRPAFPASIPLISRASPSLPLPPHRRRLLAGRNTSRLLFQAGSRGRAHKAPPGPKERGLAYVIEGRPRAGRFSRRRSAAFFRPPPSGRRRAGAPARYGGRR